MALVLCRVDDRLIHGQVVIGWGRPLGARLIILVDDGVRASGWEQDLYRMAVPEGVDVVFASTTEAVTQMPAWAADPRPAILLTGDIATMAALRGAAPDAVRRINLGGVHYRADRREVLRYLYLAPEDEALLCRLLREGAEVTAQDLPTTAAIPVGTLLR